MLLKGANFSQHSVEANCIMLSMIVPKWFGIVSNNFDLASFSHARYKI